MEPTLPSTGQRPGSPPARRRPHNDRDGDLATQVHDLLGDGADALLHTAVVGEPALSAVRDHGRAVAVLLHTPTSRHRITPAPVFVEPHLARQDDLVRLIDSGHLTLRLPDTYPLTEPGQAHQRLARVGLRARLVPTP